MYIISYDVASKSLGVSIIYFNDNWKEYLNKINKSFNNEIYKIDKTNIIDKCICINKYIDLIENLIDTLIVPKYFDVVDLIPNKKLCDTTSILRTSRLKAYLLHMDETLEKISIDKIDQTGFLEECDSSTIEHISSILYKPSYKVLLEYQMGPNDKSRTIGSQILYHYSNTDININSQCGEYNKDCLKRNTFIYDIEILGPSLKNKINLDNDKPHSFFMKKYSKTYDANKAHSKSNFLTWVKSNNIEHMIKNIKKKNIDDIADSVTMTLAWIYIKSELL